MSAAAQTAELLARLAKEKRAVTCKAQLAEIRARARAAAHGLELPEHLVRGEEQNRAGHVVVMTASPTATSAAESGRSTSPQTNLSQSQHRSNQAEDGPIKGES